MIGDIIAARAAHLHIRRRTTAAATRLLPPRGRPRESASRQRHTNLRGVTAGVTPGVDHRKLTTV